MSSDNDLSKNIKIYLKEFDSIRTVCDLSINSQFKICIDEIDNYLDQIACVQSSQLFQDDMKELKFKVFNKINNKINSKIEYVKSVLQTIESHLISMSNQFELVTTSERNSSAIDRQLVQSLLEINKLYWSKYYSLKSICNYENLREAKNLNDFKRIIHNWFTVDLKSIQYHIQICRHFTK